MTNKRCPMCGKENPEDAEVCQFCRARLKPLVIPPSESSSSGEANEDDSSLPDWLKDLQPKEDSGYEGEAGLGMEDDDLPDWLKDSPSKSRESTEESSEGTTSESESDVPDWLTRVRKKGQEEETSQTPEVAEPSMEDHEVSGWRLEGDLGEAESTDEPSDASGAEVFIPDWLSEIRSDKVQPAEPADLPDWLAEVRGQPEPESPPTPENDWLEEIGRSAGFSSKEEEALSGSTAEDVTRASETEETPAADHEETEVPGWLAKMESNAEKQGRSVPALIFDEEDALDLTDGEEGAVIFNAPDISATPEWLSNISKEDAPVEGGAEEGKPAPRLEKADLPSWLEAMRPIESAAPVTPSSGESAAEPERAGPLAGLRGVLPADIGFSRMKKPAAHSIKLQVTENQKSHVALLEGLLASEDAPKALPKGASISSQALLRLAVALMLIAAVMASLLSGTGWLPVPSGDSLPSEVVDASTLIDAMAAGEAVLVAFDYEPALAGELEAVSGVLLDQLAARGAAIAAVSTTPNGPLLAQRWLDTYTQAGGTSDILFFNLGYIPAGPAGLLAFASNPQAVTPYDLSSRYVWGSGPLAGISTADNFGLVVVLTDSPDDARAWIEQVQPMLQNSNTPLLIAASAQAEPMIRPYYESSPKQVDGLIAGLTGSMEYEIRSGTLDRAAESWDAFSVGIFTAVVIILAGSLVSGGMSLAASAKKNTGEEIQ